MVLKAVRAPFTALVLLADPPLPTPAAPYFLSVNVCNYKQAG